RRADRRRGRTSRRPRRATTRDEGPARQIERLDRHNDRRRDSRSPVRHGTQRVRPGGRLKMPPRKRAAVTAPSTMKELKDTLWKAADKLRGSMDASQYKDVILGLVFLKYVSDAFDERRQQLEAELRADGLDDEDVAS